MEVAASHLTEKGQRDCDLVEQARKGDQKAFASLLNNYRDSLYFMMLKMTNNATDADDLTIEAFGKAFNKLDQYSTDYAFSTWLFRIAANNCIDFMRKNSRIQIVTPIGNEEENGNYPANLASDMPAPDDKIMARQKIELMHEVVEKLKPHYRQLIELRYFKEWSYEEISDELQLPLGTVKAQLFRAREFLYNILKNSVIVE